MTKNVKLVGQAKRDALLEAAYQRRIQARYGKNSHEYGRIALKKNWK